MTPAPDVQPFPYNRRRYLFIFLFLIFLVALPSFMFYAIGYRFDFSGEIRNIISTGGIYVTAQNNDVDIYLDEKLVSDVRIFRSASYIQNLNEGSHRLTVQRKGQYTWTKDLPVFPHIVTEAQAFNLPLVPQIRLVTEYRNALVEPVVFVASSSESVLAFASSTSPIYISTSSATSTLYLNPEYEYVTALFASSSATTSANLLNRVAGEVERAFQFSSTASTTPINIATSTKVWREVQLSRIGDEVYASWEGRLSNIPYYYCVDYVVASSTKALYGDHVYQSIAEILATTTLKNVITRNDRTLICRAKIRLDRKWQRVLDFDFFPDSVDLVLLLLEDGLYVVEIDDRSWQNTQLLYPGNDLSLLLDGGQIYVRDRDYYLEVLTSLPN